ncbi:MAG: tetratricopeptide repeat protein, partial [Deltaproteobacteria bacterium]|nr:tetratricopeptide repeat protein [Deltaproteobacteria bacterium]
LVACLWLWSGVRVLPDLLGRWTQSDLYPVAALRYLEALQRPGEPPLRVLNYYNWGGFLMLHSPDLKLLIDGRANTLYSDRIYMDYVAMLRARPGFSARVSRYPADVALLPPGGFALKLLRQADPWVMLYSDSQARLLAAPDSRLRGRRLDLETVLRGDPMLHLQRAAAARQREDPAAAVPEIEQALALDPNSTRAWAELFAALSQRRDRAALDEAVARGVAQLPRRREELYTRAAAAYVQLGDLLSALPAARAGIPSGPFRNPVSARRRVREIEQHLERVDRAPGSP